MTQLVDATGKPLPPEEAPSEDRLRIYGDAMFLAFRSAYHAGMSVANLRSAFEPPLVLGQFRVFRFDGVPRAIYTWAFLSPEAERRYVRGELLRPEDWSTAGGRMWLIDLIAPYRGLMAGIWDWVMVPGNVSNEGFLFSRPGNQRRARRIVEVRFDRPGKTLRVLTEADFS